MSLLPSTPRLTPFDSRSFVKPLREQVTKPDDKPYIVYGEAPFPNWVGSLRKLRDHAQKITTFANDLKRHLDRNSQTLVTHDGRLDRAEADIALLKAQDPPFPIA